MNREVTMDNHWRRHEWSGNLRFCCLERPLSFAVSANIHHHSRGHVTHTYSCNSKRVQQFRCHISSQSFNEASIEEDPLLFEAGDRAYLSWCFGGKALCWGPRIWFGCNFSHLKYCPTGKEQLVHLGWESLLLCTSYIYIVSIERRSVQPRTRFTCKGLQKPQPM